MNWEYVESFHADRLRVRAKGLEDSLDEAILAIYFLHISNHLDLLSKLTDKEPIRYSHFKNFDTSKPALTIFFEVRDRKLYFHRCICGTT